MKLTITLDNLDEAISKLEELANKIEQFPGEVAMETASKVAYPGTYADIQQGKSKVLTPRSDQIAFEEYGAGFVADEDIIVIDGAEELTYPGVWSEDHEKTMMNYNGDPMAYRYNRVPKRYMRTVAETLAKDTEDKARRYFDN